MKRLPQGLMDLMREALADAWDSGYRQARDEMRPEYAGPFRPNPWRTRPIPVLPDHDN